jgi:hypothetical protein
MRPNLELDLDAGGRGKVVLNGFGVPFTTGVKVEASLNEPTKVWIDFLPVTTGLRIQRVDLSRKTIEGLEAICRQWRYENDERSLVDYAALRAFELWVREQDLAVPPRSVAGPAAAFDRFVEIYREELAK